MTLIRIIERPDGQRFDFGTPHLQGCVGILNTFKKDKDFLLSFLKTIDTTTSFHKTHIISGHDLNKVKLLAITLYSSPEDQIPPAIITIVENNPDPLFIVIGILYILFKMENFFTNPPNPLTIPMRRQGVAMKEIFDTFKQMIPFEVRESN